MLLEWGKGEVEGEGHRCVLRPRGERACVASDTSSEVIVPSGRVMQGTAGGGRRGDGEGLGLVGALSWAGLFLSLAAGIRAMIPWLPELSVLPEPWLDLHTLPSHTGRVSQCMVKNPGP